MLRKTGIEVVGAVPWGTHFCQFYHTADDLKDILVPYFREGLAANEFCMWVTSEPLPVEAAKAALRAEVPDLDALLKEGRIEILDYRDWYVDASGFDAERVLAGWVHKLDQALQHGFEGLRLSGNTLWLKKDDWKTFQDYEAAVDTAVSKRSILALCTYSLPDCNALEVIDVAANHQFVLIRNNGCWETIQSSQRQRKEAELQKLNRALRALTNNTHALMRAADEQSYLSEVCQIIVRDCGYAMCWIGAAEDDEAKFVRPVASAGFEEGYLETLRVTWADTERGRGPTGSAIRTKSVSVCNNMLTDARFAPWREQALKRGYASSLALPLLLADDEAFGAITIYSRAPDPFTADEVQLLIELAADIAHGVSVLRLRASQAKAQRALLNSEERYRTLFNNMTEGFALHQIITDEAGQACDYRFLDVNPSFERLTGLKRERLLGHRVMEVLPDNDRYWVDLYGKVALTGEPLHIERYSTPLNRWYEVFAFSPEPQLFAVIFLDISARKEAEKSLQEHGERMEILSQAAAQLLAASDPEQMVRDLFQLIADRFHLDAYFNFMVNEAGDALHLDSCAGIPEEKAKSLCRLEFGQAVCGTVATTRESYHATHIQTSNEEITALVKSFGIRAYACNPLLAGSRLLGTLSFATRERDAFTDEELQFFATICHYVATAKERLRWERALKQADKRKDEFLALLGHELRNPLAAISSGMNLLARTDPGNGREAWVRDVINQQVTHLSRMLDDLLDVSRIARGKLELKMERLSVAELLRESAEIVDALMKRSQHTFELRTPGADIAVQGDPVRLQQILVNLLTNAAKYTPEGGKIIFSAEAEDGLVSIQVRDNGVGIPPEMQGRVFEMFGQVDSAMHRAQGGLGIGLSLVKTLTEMHGGVVRLESPGSGKGSTFTVRLPCAKQAEQRQIPAARLEGPGNSRLRVLVIEDNKDMAAINRILLEEQGYQVAVVHDGLSAFDAASLLCPEVVLLDIGLPGIDGYEVAVKLRRDSRFKETLIIATTAWGQEDDRRRSREAGIDFHLVKPVKPETLIPIITRWHACRTKKTSGTEQSTGLI